MRIRRQVANYHLVIFAGKCVASDVPKLYDACWNVFKILKNPVLNIAI